ncbi:MAG TPA: hydroxyacid dehydrogenase [Burkholderiaceae bacterium]|nr:hydroxyacid dehydrogenase [Burkholderiaceae bacterium]
MKIIIPESILPESLERLRAVHEVHFDPDLVADRTTLVRAARGAHAIIVRRLTQVRAELLDAMPDCRAVGRLGVGLDNIDVEACRARNIRVIPAVGANARSVAEYVVAAAMILVRGVFFSTADVADCRWPKEVLNNGREVAGLTMGIVGLGSIGRNTAALARNVGMRVVACGRPGLRGIGEGVEWLTLPELLGTSDVVSLHLPLSAQTWGLIDRAAIATMKPGAILINAARGGIVDDAALIEALRAGRLGGAAIDAFESEPLVAGNIYEGVPNLILTPHIAGVTRDSERRVNRMVVDKVLEALAS